MADYWHNNHAAKLKRRQYAVIPLAARDTGLCRFAGAGGVFGAKMNQIVIATPCPRDSPRYAGCEVVAWNSCRKEQTIWRFLTATPAGTRRRTRV